MFYSYNTQRSTYVFVRFLEKYSKRFLNETTSLRHHIYIFDNGRLNRTPVVKDFWSQGFENFRTSWTVQDPIKRGQSRQSRGYIGPNEG